MSSGCVPFDKRQGRLSVEKTEPVCKSKKAGDTRNTYRSVGGARQKKENIFDCNVRILVRGKKADVNHYFGRGVADLPGDQDLSFPAPVRDAYADGIQQGMADHPAGRRRTWNPLTVTDGKKGVETDRRGRTFFKSL